MLSQSIGKLLDLASASLDKKSPELSKEVCELAGSLSSELLSILQARNGFYAFESALQFFPAESSLLSIGIKEWNSPSNWREEYGSLTAGCLFFAQDIFGGQFCIIDNRVCTFDPETGEQTVIGSSLDEWASAILADYRTLTGQPLARAWQEEYGPVPEGMRLVPRTPFVFNGEFLPSNLVIMNSERGMRTRANIARQIHGLADNSVVKLEIED